MRSPLERIALSVALAAAVVGLALASLHYPSTAAAQPARPHTPGTQPPGTQPPGTPPAFDPGAMMFWVHQAATARPFVTEQLQQMRDELVATTALAETMRGPNKAAVLARLRSLESRLDVLTERIEGALAPTAFARVDWNGAPVLVQVPVEEPALHNPPRHHGRRAKADDRSLTSDTFAALHRQMKEASFDSSRTDALRAALGDHMLSTDQTAQLLATYGFDSERMAAAKILLPRLSDPDQAFRLLDSVTFDSDKRTLREWIEAL